MQQPHYVQAPAPQHITHGGQVYQATSYAPTRTRVTNWIRHAEGERRLDEDSARLLARQVFYKYDTNRSGFMNSQEAAGMVSDLYLSINEHKPSSQQDGLDFMVANDINNDHSMSLEDFEDIFVRHLSSHDNTGYSLTSPYVTAAHEERTTPGRMVQQFPNGLPPANPALRANHPNVEIAPQVPVQPVHTYRPQQVAPTRQGLIRR